ncbi:hypothetical protein JQ557_23025 [Bradyrhizobium sp. U87765 SZCCT0131]|uniref:hypothetical protein n=1 Tax=unclassified Bradyrhizobium TaxID=2631580 RepID=UPI001BA824BA|nr:MULTISPECIES: hypothetical protein [unclassified Bradyrhizobium]MBR1220893.1 hypothetical protein [Bradyrhizobium sp. U87765 SZCCT0131]MBR1260287.1 hypothetical protein [Bradyrhizobium sp. U87765 SZCCT0134]MBR1307464.1 hypothetical protein [Bradyrhizobium sp. U87765 SZCCT0110]MBR1321418.1 hypothetical protein [Bradyrhizobium sp. U87765 SZCCT0109]MBR1349731.1 hypothetical protein [Bradyrhizobium sp. U87765 SZCCT0048]
MSVSLKTLSLAASAVVIAAISASAAIAADDIRLSSNQRISCSRGLSAGKLQTSTCRSFAYIFNGKTSDYFRCTAAMTVTKDNKDFIQIQTEGGNCQKRERVFATDSSYSFDAAETEGPNTNSIYGPGGFVMWVSDNTKLAAKACFTIAVGGTQPDVHRCIDMKFE